MIGVPTPTLKAAVRADNEYLQLTAKRAGTRAAGAHAYQVHDDDLSREATLSTAQVTGTRSR